MKLDWRCALDIYVTGRNQALSTEQKRREAGARGHRTARSPASGNTTGGSATFGVSIPETLEYYRNAGIWRDRIDDISSGEAERGV